MQALQGLLFQRFRPHRYNVGTTSGFQQGTRIGSVRFIARALALCGRWTGLAEEQAQPVLIIESGAEFTTADAVTRRAVMA